MFLKKYLNLWNWTFEYGVFRFFANFWVAKLKRLSVKARQSVKNCSQQNLVIRSLLETGFGAILRSKMNVLSLWKWHFSVFYKFVRDEIESAFWENEVNRSKLFKAKVGHRKNLRKWFWSYLEVKDKCSEPLEMGFFTLLQICKWQSWNCLLENWGNVLKTV